MRNYSENVRKMSRRLRRNLCGNYEKMMMKPGKLAEILETFEHYNENCENTESP